MGAVTPNRPNVVKELDRMVAELKALERLGGLDAATLNVLRGVLRMVMGLRRRAAVAKAR